MTTIISFYSPDKFFVDCANRLKTACRRLGLKHKILPVDKGLNWSEYTLYKPTFILEQLTEPVLWVDVDSIIHRCPPLVFDKPIGLVKSHDNVFDIKAGTMYFAPEGVDFVLKWWRICKTGTGDHGHLAKVHETYDKSKIQLLSKEYCLNTAEGYIQYIVSNTESKKQCLSR